MKTNSLITRQNLFLGFITCCILVFGKQLYAQETVVINEINYRNVNKQENIKFVELYNYGNTAVSISNWHLAGGANYTFPVGTNIGANSFLVVAQNKVQCQIYFGINGVLGNIEGNLSASGDKITLRNSAYDIIDEVDYESWKEWPNVRYSDYEVTQAIPQNTSFSQDVTIKVDKSIQRINPLLDGKHGGSWSAANPTPKVQNSNYKANPNILPVVKSVSKSPDKPESNETVRIKVDFDNHELYQNNLSVTVLYQENAAGSYKIKSDIDYNSSFLELPMNDNQMNGDSTANNGVYTTTLPAFPNRTLIRYKIKVEAANGYVRYFPDPNHDEDNYSYYVYNGDANFLGYSFANVDTTMQNITIITKESITDEFISTGDNTNQDNGYDYDGEGTLIYNGKIFDHINFRPRGKNRDYRIKPGIKFDLNKEKGILLENDCGKDYDAERDKLILSGTWVNDAASHGLVESLIYKILELTGGWFNYTDYVSLRIVDSSTETGVNGDFWGLFLTIEDNNGELLKEHDLPDGNIWTTFDGPGIRFMYVDYFGDFPGTSSQGPWFSTSLGGDPVTPPDTNILNKEMLFGDWIGNEFWANGELNYYEKHSYREYYNPETGKWIGWCKDYDGAFGSGNNVEGVSTTLNSDPNFDIVQPLNIPGSLSQEYKGELRSAVDLLLNSEQRNFLVDSELKKIYDPLASYDWTTLDHARWGSNRPCPTGFLNCTKQEYDGANGTVDTQFQWYKDWFNLRRNYLLSNSTHGVNDPAIPNKPSISLTGSNAVDNLTFWNSNFSDGTGSFEAYEWRIAEWSDPNNPFYIDKCKPIYEIEPVWESGEKAPFSNSFTFPPDAQLKIGRTYKVRVRYKDSTGRWSHWSNAYKFISQPAQDQNADDIVINEIMYNPKSDCGSEYIEIYNNENFSINLTNYKFTKGIDFDFPAGTILAPNAYLVLAQDSIDFKQKYGFSPFGDYKGSLDDNDDYIELLGPNRVVVDSLTYRDNDPWDEGPDDTGMSLELLDPSLDNADPFSWFRTENLCGTPAAPNSMLCTGSAQSIVINEINYNSNNLLFDPGDWVELYNPTANPIDLSGWSFHDSSNDFVIPAGTIIPANGFRVLVENDTLFAPLFPDVDNTIQIANFAFGLSNKGERISLFDDNNCFADYVVFDDISPWPTGPDGNGPSLALISPSLDNALGTSWESSDVISFANGTPGCPNQPVDCFDLCPNDPNKTEPGACGCGVPDTDSDLDGVADCIDSCPTDPNKSQPGICGCNVADTDSDSDGTPNCNDACPSDPGKTQPGICGCNVADTDSDSDGTPNCNDACPSDPNKTQAGICGCGNADVDTDMDGTLDCLDGCPSDPNKTQAGLCGCGNVDIDNNNNGTCDAYEDPCSTLYADDFEVNSGIWNVIANADANREASPNSPGGSYSMLIFDNEPDYESATFSNTLNLSQVVSLKVVFDYRSVGFIANQSFFLELSTDGGSSFTTVNEWVSGPGFNDNIVYSDSLSIPNSSLSATSVLRFRCNGNINSDRVYLDNIRLKSCQDSCENYITYSDNIGTNVSEEAIIGIETNRVINAGSNVTHNAGQYILLNPGFEIKANAEFHAFIQACQ